jgi:uncharacterized phage-like protein YoqJ
MLMTCSFTGHRPQRFSFGFDEEHTDCIKLKLVLSQEISKLIENGVTEFLSGMALGVDVWGAEIVLALRDQGKVVRLVCVLPCESQADKWSASDRDRYFTILEKADDVLYISRHYTETCMRGRKIYIADHANIVLAVYDGERQGGTAQTVRYAHMQGKPILIIDPATFKVTPYMVVIQGGPQHIEKDI